MGISIERALSLRQKYSSVARDIFSAARTYRSPMQRIQDELKEHLYDQRHYQMMPHWCKSYIAGMVEELYKTLYRYELEWKHFIPAKEGFLEKDSLLTIPETRRLSTTYPDVYQDINRNSNSGSVSRSNYYWIGTEKPF